jgi:PAS domain S-box-containing protein
VSTPPETRTSIGHAQDKMPSDEIDTSGYDLDDAGRLLAAVFDRAPTGMALEDPSGRFLKVNAAYRKLVGRTESELLGMSWQQVTHPDDVGPFEERVRAAAGSDRGAFGFEKRYVRSDGTVVWAWASITMVLDPERGAPHLLVQATDITDRVEAAERGKEFLRDISHELRTPLTSILGASTVLEGRCDDTDPETRDQLIGLIASNARRMSELLDRVMGFTREERA